MMASAMGRRAAALEELLIRGWCRDLVAWVPVRRSALARGEEEPPFPDAMWSMLEYLGRRGEIPALPWDRLRTEVYDPEDPAHRQADMAVEAVARLVLAQR